MFSLDFAEDSALSPGEHSEKAATQSCSPDRIHGNVPLVGMIGIDWPLKNPKSLTRDLASSLGTALLPRHV